MREGGARQAVWLLTLAPHDGGVAECLNNAQNIVSAGRRGQELPRGMEVLASLGGADTPSIARIPTRWRLEVAAPASSAAAALRMDVTGGNGKGEWTTVGDIQEALRAHLGRADGGGRGWPALLVDGKRVADPALTIVAAQLFGAKVACCIDDCSH